MALGEVLDTKGREQEAVEALKTTIQNDQQFSKSHCLLGQIYRKQKLQEKAKKELQTFQELTRPKDRRNTTTESE